jgi:hypothetical protein
VHPLKLENPPYDFEAAFGSLAAASTQTIEDSLDQQELERRRDIVRRIFNDFWKSAGVKPVQIRGATKSGRRLHQ